VTFQGRAVADDREKMPGDNIMRIVLADLKGLNGLVSKDTVAGGYGSRMVPFSRATRIYCHFKKKVNNLPSVQLAYLAAIGARAGHDISWTSGEQVEGDVALVLSSLVDYRRETAWADEARRHGLRVGFVGLAASKMPELFETHADFIIQGEPESAMFRLVQGEHMEGNCTSPPIQDLDALPFPLWNSALSRTSLGNGLGIWTRNFNKCFPVLGSRGCTEFCTYCPHRILAEFRLRSVKNIVDELEMICDQYPFPLVIFRDSLFTQNRERTQDLCDEILSRGLKLQFHCETRLDHLDEELLNRLWSAGLRAISFGVESVSEENLRKAGRRVIPEVHQRKMMEACRRHGIASCGYYVLGFPDETWASASATIDYSISLGSTFAQFKLLTPYPGTPLWKRSSSWIFETDLEKFDGFTPTFHHPHLSSQELRFLLGAAYARFYARPSYLSNYLRIRNERIRDWIQLLDQKVFARHAEKEYALMSRSLTC
jgi:anaerobic magnesium-protoporphyrin IX monomethyl ester cyclase